MIIKTNRQVLSEQLAQGKIRTFDIQDYTPAKLARLSEKTIKDVHNNLRKLTLDRLRGLYKAGFVTKEQVEKFRMMKTWTQIETPDEAVMSINKYVGFLSDIRRRLPKIRLYRTQGRKLRHRLSVASFPPSF